MSLNWVMLSGTEGGFVKLPSERILYTSPPRTSLSLSSKNTFPGTQPWSVKSDGGKVHLTNQRLVYIPTTPTPTLQSFSAPILNCQDSYVRAPFFGANYWGALVRPVEGGNIPPLHPAVELRMTFQEGGAFDFHTKFEEIKERIDYAVAMAREEGRNIGSVGVLGEADLAAVHLEQLPAYELASGPPTPTVANGRDPNFGQSLNVQDAATGGTGGLDIPKPEEDESDSRIEPPNGPPPGYEEAQAQALSLDFDRRLRAEAELL